MEQPDHKDSILTSKYFANEDKFKKVCQEFGKVDIRDGQKYYSNPLEKSFKQRNKKRTIK